MKMLSMVCCALVLACSLAAKDYHYGFEDVTKDEKGITVPAHWTWYSHFNQQHGSWRSSEDAMEGDFAMQIHVNPSIRSHLRVYLKQGLFISAAPGTQIRLSFHAKGKGRLGAGLYCYGSKKNYVTEVKSAFRDVDFPQYQEMVFSLTVPKHPDKQIVSFLPVLNVAGSGSDFLVDAMTVSVPD